MLGRRCKAAAANWTGQRSKDEVVGAYELEPATGEAGEMALEREARGNEP